jgi:hypothetical protein
MLWVSLKPVREGCAHVPEVVQIQSQLMIEPTTSATPAEFDAFLDRARRKWGDIARRSARK